MTGGGGAGTLPPNETGRVTGITRPLVLVVIASQTTSAIEVLL